MRDECAPLSLGRVASHLLLSSLRQRFRYLLFLLPQTGAKRLYYHSPLMARKCNFNFLSENGNQGMSAAYCVQITLKKKCFSCRINLAWVVWGFCFFFLCSLGKRFEQRLSPSILAKHPSYSCRFFLLCRIISIACLFSSFHKALWEVSLFVLRVCVW